MLSREQYAHWLAVARRHARRSGEAEDLLHNAILAAINAGRRDLADPTAAAWFAGVLRNLAAMEARTAARRKSREQADRRPDGTETPPVDELDAWLRAVAELPRAARAVAVLALGGLNREEIAYVLRLSDVALRQRLTTVRKAWAALDAAHRPATLPTLRSTHRTRLELGLLRQALLSVLRVRGGIGTHDPDGHLIVLKTPSQSGSRRQR